MLASSFSSTTASSSIEPKPSDASNCPTTSSRSSASMNILVRFWNSAWRRSDSSCSVRMSMSQPVSCEARRTFWPRRPIASESCGIRHDDFDALAILVEHDLGDFGRRQRVDDEGRDVLRPRNDVDLLALQFVHHRLHARAAHADAGADRIDRGIARNHRDLGARARIAGDRLDLDDAVIDFRHFLREQLRHELRMRARKENLRTARLAAHVVDDRRGRGRRCAASRAAASRRGG